MNRSERRAREKEKKKDESKKVEALAWLRTLPATKQTLINSLVKLEAKKDHDSLLQAIDRCFSAAIVGEFENLSWQDVERVMDKSAELMLDDAKKMKVLKDELGGSYDMAVKKVNEMAPAVEERARELIKEGFNQKVSIKMLGEEFKGLSTAMLTNAFKKTKALVAEEQKLKKIAEQEEKAEDISNKIKEVLGEPDKEMDKFLEYIFEEKEDKNINTSKDTEKTTTEENRSIETVVKNNNSKFKVVKEVTKVIEREVKGEHGLYNIRGSVVTVNEESAFMNVEEVNCWASDEREELVKQMNEIKDKINKINLLEAEAIEVIETFMNI